MANTTLEDVEKWCKRELTDITEDGSISRIELWHAIEGEGGERLRSFRKLAEYEPEDVANTIYEVAEADAKTRTVGMVQRYVLQSFRGDNDDPEPESQFAFILRGNSQANLLAGDTEGPTPAGKLGQEMRHSENLHRMMMQMTEVTAGRLARDVESERKMRLAAEARFIDVAELYQKLLDKSHERDLEKAKATQSAKRDDQIFGLVMSVLPLIAAKFMGGNAGIAQSAPASGARDIAIGKLLQNLSPQEVDGIFKSLSPQNQLPLLELYKSYAEDFAKQQASTPEVLRDGQEVKEASKADRQTTQEG